MITQFEELTTELNADELAILPIVVEILSNTSEANPLKAPVLHRLYGLVLASSPIEPLPD